MSEVIKEVSVKPLLPFLLFHYSNGKPIVVFIKIKLKNEFSCLSGEVIKKLRKDLNFKRIYYDDLIDYFLDNFSNLKEVSIKTIFGRNTLGFRLKGLWNGYVNTFCCWCNFWCFLWWTYIRWGYCNNSRYSTRYKEKRASELCLQFNPFSIWNFFHNLCIIFLYKLFAGINQLTFPYFTGFKNARKAVVTSIIISFFRKAFLFRRRVGIFQYFLVKRVYSISCLGNTLGYNNMY